jgi:nucleotide-binding universal stress UspA family protein
MSDKVTRGAVIVGVDRSPGTGAALAWAADQAALTRRPLVAVHGTGFPSTRPHSLDVLEAEHELLENGRALVAEAVDAACRRQPDLAVSGLVEVGHPATLLLEHAEGAEMLVVGARREGPADHILSSVSLAAARHATCPLVVARPAREPAAGAPPAPVVLGLDGTAASVDAAAFAFESASLRGAELLVLHGTWDRPPAGHPAAGDQLAEDERLAIGEVVAGLPEKYPDVPFRTVLRAGDPAKALIEESAAAQLVVVGARRLGEAWATILTRSVSTALVQHARCPVAVVRTAG